MHRPELRIASLFVLLTACSNTDPQIQSEGSSEAGESSSTTDDSSATRPTTTTQSTLDTTGEPTSGGTTLPPESTSTGPDTSDDATSTTSSTTSATTSDDTGSTGDTSDTDTSTGEPSTCANGALDPGEVCDADLLDGQDCQSQGFDSGTLACAADCSDFDNSGCSLFSCGNGVVEGIESCDGDDLVGQDCIMQGFAGGNLSCADNCGSFNTAACFKCGNDLVDGADVCDGADLAGSDCAAQGFDGGNLSCADDCSAYVVSDCYKCGDNSIAGPELCDGAALDGETCATQGFSGGTLACNNTCNGYDTSSCNACGNGAIDNGEQCDGAALGGATCVSKGATSGTLGCFTDCNFNATQCLTNVDESEPNDDTMVAVGVDDFSAMNADGPFGGHTLIHGAITPLGDDDFYAVTNPTNLPATVRLETFGTGGVGTCVTIDTDMFVVTANDTPIAHDDQSGINSCSLLDNLPLGPGETFYVRIIDWLDNTLITSYYLDVQIVPTICGDGNIGNGEQCDDSNLVNGDGCSSLCKLEGLTEEIEPNNTNPQADMTGLVSTGDSLYSGAITPNSDVDRYKLDLAAAQWLRIESFQSINDCKTLTTTLRLFDSANTALVADAAGLGIGGCGAVVFPLPAGSAYVQVEETGKDAAVPFYLLDIQSLTDKGNETEPNETIATANTNLQTGSDQIVFGDHMANADADYYAIDVPQGGSLRIETVEGDRTVKTCEALHLDTRVTLYNSMGTLLVDDDDEGRGYCSLIDGTGTTPLDPAAHNLAAGTYYIQVRASSLSQNNDDGKFTYHLTATVRTP